MRGVRACRLIPVVLAVCCSLGAGIYWVADPHARALEPVAALFMRSAGGLPRSIPLQLAAVLALFGLGVCVAATQVHASRRLGQQKEELRAVERGFRLAFEQGPIGMGEVGRDGRWLHVNRTLCQMLGYTAQELAGTPVHEYLPAEELRRTKQCRERMLSGHGAAQTVESRFRHRSGRDVWVLTHAVPVKDPRGKPAHAIVQVVDITERRRSELALTYAADHDDLTGLYNRRAFTRILTQSVSEEGRCGALVLLDLDQFKYVNDRLGHQAGDTLLKSLADLLTRVTGEKGVLARVGGDEFAILLPRAGAPEAEAVADQLVEAIGSHTLMLKGQPVCCSASLGVVLYPDHARTAEELYALADIAMYRAKEEGRNRFHLLDAEFDHARRDIPTGWEREIRSALAEERLCLHAQPIKNLRTGTVTQFELLVRLVEPDGEVVMPGLFLPQAERLGLVSVIDRWVVKKAIGLIADLERRGASIPLEVNLSGRAVTDPGLLTCIQRHLEETGINPAHLVIEVTETAAISDMNQARHFVETLKGLGCQFAVDDFGAGYSSIQYLKQLPVDYLKVDGSLIRGVVTDPVNQHLVRSIAAMARGLGKWTVAEYVEDAETERLLQSYQVDFAQGFHIGRPQPVEVALSLSNLASH